MHHRGWEWALISSYLTFHPSLQIHFKTREGNKTFIIDDIDGFSPTAIYMNSLTHMGFMERMWFL